MSAFRALGLAVLCVGFLPNAFGATACPPASIAGSPNSLTTSRPTGADAASATQCSKAAKNPPKSTAKVTAAAPAAVVAAAVPAAPAWKSVLDPLPAGGWKYISDGPVENPSVVYASSHAVMHNGNVVTAWIRWEFARPQGEVYPLHYLSAVTREVLDCDARTYRRTEVIYYIRNNLREKGPSFTALDDDTSWRQAIPGSEPDAMLNWGCAAPASVPHAKSSAKLTPAAISSAPAASAPASSAPAGGTELHTAR